MVAKTTAPLSRAVIPQYGQRRLVICTFGTRVIKIGVFFMLKPVKIVVGPSPHYYELKTGSLKYQKSKPDIPIWRILVINEAKNIMYMRFFSNKPSAADIDHIVLGLLAAKNMLIVDIVIPASVEKLCPGLQKKLTEEGAKIYVPAHGFASGSLAAKEADKFIMLLEASLNLVRESMASCGEIAAVAGNSLGAVMITLWRKKDDERRHKVNIATKMAHDITRLRGRDPEVGKIMRGNESVWGPLNKSKQVVPPEDVLATLLKRSNQLNPSFGEIISLLKEIKSSEPDSKMALIQELGAVTTQHQIAGVRKGDYSFISSLLFHLSDPCLQYVVLLGLKEALKMLIVLSEGLLQVAVAKVLVQYSPECINLTARGIPAHYRIEKMIQQRSGGKVALLPELIKPEVSKVLPIWGPFRSPVFTDRSQFNPTQCGIPLKKGECQMKDGILIALAILPRDTKSYIPLNDYELAGHMTELVNERLARNGAGITCQIMPFQPGGSMIAIGQPPQELYESMGIKLCDQVIVS
jgi:hypothetical protein